MPCKCRRCNTCDQWLPTHVSRYYLPLRHGALAKYVLRAIIIKNNPEHHYHHSRESEYIKKIDHYEYWRNLPIITPSKVPLNKPDLIMWNKLKKICTVIEFSCPSDVNVAHKIQEKMSNYAPLLRNMQIIYPDYRFEMMPMIAGALGFVPSCLFNYKTVLGFDKKGALRLISKMQAFVSSGTIKFCKTLINF